MKFHCKQGSVEHRIFCRTGVNAQSVNGYMSGTGVKVFVFQFAQFASVYGIGKVSAIPALSSEPSRVVPSVTIRC